MELVGIEQNPAPAGAAVIPVRTADGVTLRAAHWPRPAGSERGSVFLIQGRNEYIEKYFEVIGALQARGFAVTAFDLRGQGGSQRVHPRGLCHVETFADYDRDLDAAWQDAFLRIAPRPHLGLAHSMGSLLALRAAHDGRAAFDRLAAVAPMIGLARFAAPPLPLVRTVSSIALFLGLGDRPLSRKPWDRWKAADPHKDWRQARNAAIVAAAPSLRAGLPSTRWLHASGSAMAAAQRPAFGKGIPTRTLIFTAGADNVVDNGRIADLAATMPAVAVAPIEGARHEILMDPDAIYGQFWTGFDRFVA